MLTQYFCPATLLTIITKKNISEASGPILIKFMVNHHCLGGLNALGFRVDCIKIVVSMATDSSRRLTMGKTKKIFFSETGHKAQTFFILYVAMFVVPIINCANRAAAPGVQFDHAPGASISAIGLCSETIRLKAYILGLQQRYALFCINPANHAPGDKNGPTLGVISSHIHLNLFIALLLGSKPISVLAIQTVL